MFLEQISPEYRYPSLQSCESETQKFSWTVCSPSAPVHNTSSDFPEYLLNLSTSSTTTITLLPKLLSYPDRTFVSYVIYLHSFALIPEGKGKLQIELHLPFSLSAPKISIYKTLQWLFTSLGMLQLLNMIYNASAPVWSRALANSHNSSFLPTPWPFGPLFLLFSPATGSLHKLLSPVWKHPPLLTPSSAFSS